MLDIQTIVVTPFMQNARLLSVSGSKGAVLIDPGGDTEIVLSALEASGKELIGIWLTHSHLDHCGGVAALKRRFDVPLVAHAREADMRAGLKKIAAMYGLELGDMEICPEPQQFIKGGERLELGPLSFEVRFAPGHSPGHVVFYCESEGVVVAGDTLFAGSIGRSDLPGGDHDTLIESISSQLLSLPPHTRVLPGHGPDTTIGQELETNPFFVR